jgi:hypothetical protein
MGTEKKPQKKYMFFGFPANPTGGPNPELGSGLIFNPDMVIPLLRLFGVGKEKPEAKQDEVKGTTDITTS